MFDALTERLGDIFDRLRRRGALSDSDVTGALRELRIALLEADVALPVVKKLVEDVSEQAVGTEILRSVTPGQMVVKLVHDRLVEMLGGEAVDLDLAAPAPAAIMLVGLQGSGKTTTTAKIGKRLQEREKKKVLMASLDVARPAAQEQLRALGEQAGIATLPIVAGQQPVDIARRAMQAARLGGYDIVLLDTAGRLHVDEQLMDEVAGVRDAANPVETLLVADAMTGQDAVNVAEGFHGRIGLTGIALTRVDGDARGGAALSMRAVTGQPIKLIGVGEGLDALEGFHPERIANRILGMGDVVGLVEKAAETIEQEEAEKLAKKMQKGNIDLDDLALQLRQMRKMGGLSGVMSMLPGVSKVQKQMAEARIDDKEIGRQEAIISSMTPKERKSPKIIQASRKRRIASGSGTSVSEVNKLLKQHLMMVKVMKKMGRMGKKGLMRQGLPGMPGMPGGG
ncbi:MAG: signal recognition particle protein [Alphaproteobacteria bacterium]|nr:signal recognition particle protein [Alphaproteobacteria bacterium]